MPLTITPENNDFMREAYEAGLQKGQAEGRRQQAAYLLQQMLEQRFGTVPQTVSRRLFKADLKELEAASLRLFKATKVQDVFPAKKKR